MLPSHAFLAILSLWAIHTGATSLADSAPEDTSDVHLELQTEAATKTKVSLDLGACVNVNPDGKVKSYHKTGKNFTFCRSWTAKDCKGDRSETWLSTQEAIAPPVTVQSVQCKHILRILI